MKITKAVQRKFDTQERILGKLYDLFPVGEEQHKASIKALSTTMEESEGPMAMSLKTFNDLNILSRRTTYPGFQDQTTHLTLLVPIHEARELLAGWHTEIRDTPHPKPYPSGGKGESRLNAGGRKPKQPDLDLSLDLGQDDKVALATKPASEGEELVAVAGPEKGDSPWEVLRPLRKDQSRALVEAARQYKNKSTFLRTKIEELRGEGFHVEESMFRFDIDERLEFVGLVLPYVDSLIAENERVSRWIEQVRVLGHDKERLERDNRALRLTNERLVRERVVTPAATATG